MSRIVAICAGLMSLLVLTPTALAAESPSHPFLAETNGIASASNRPPTGAFEDACGVALDSHGDRYVADYYHDAVDVFGPSGEYLTQIAKESDGNGPCGLAVDAAGRVYVENWRAEVARYTPSTYPPTAATAYGERALIDPAGTATGVTVDAATGDLYVDDTTYIAHFEAPVHAGETPARIGEGQIGEGYGLARSSFASTAGDLYVPDAATGTVKVFGAAGESLPAIDGAGSPQQGFDYLVDSAVAVDPTDGHVFVADNVERGVTEHPALVLDEFNPSGAYRGQISRWITHPAKEPGVLVEHALQAAEPSGLAIDPGGNVYVTSGNSDGSESGMLDKDGHPVEGSVLYTFGPTSPARTLTVSRSGTGGGTVASSPAGIVCGGACAAEYDEGAKVTLTATPDAHSVFLGWGGACAGSASSCQVTMSASRSVDAEFTALPQQTLTVSLTGGGEGTVTSEPAGIECSVGTCEEGFNEGSSVSLTATPAPHNRFAEWLGPDCDESTQPTCELTMSSGKALSAKFEPIPQRSLALSVNGEGSVESQPGGIECPTYCSAGFDEGSTVVLTPKPAVHHQLGAWGGACAGTAPGVPCQVSMDEDEMAEATFVPVERDLTVVIAGEGSVSADHGSISDCVATCSGRYLDGEAVALRATPGPGYSFAGWSGGQCGGIALCQFTIEAATEVTANFAAVPSPPTEPNAPRLALGRVTVKGTTATLALRVSGRGAVLATGHRLRTVRASAKAAGPVTLHLALSRAGQRALRRSRRGQLSVRVSVTFTPSDGGPPVSAKKTVTFEGRKGR